MCKSYLKSILFEMTSSRFNIRSDDYLVFCDRPRL